MCKCARSRLLWRVMTAARHWRTTLRDALLAARKDRDSTRDAQLHAPSSGTIAGGVVGLGAAEVARRELSEAQIRSLLHGEVDERLAAAKQIDASHTERAATLRIEAAVLSDLLGDV